MERHSINIVKTVIPVMDDVYGVALIAVLKSRFNIASLGSMYVVQKGLSGLDM